MILVWYLLRLKNKSSLTLIERQELEVVSRVIHFKATEVKTTTKIQDVLRCRFLFYP